MEKPSPLPAACRAFLAAKKIDPTVGFFGPDSATWRLYRSPIILFGGARALLLQIADPRVGEGVARFSRFREDALGRGFRTFEAMATLYFGDEKQARAVGERLFQMHAGMRGVAETGEKFTANRADLLAWVLATLTDTSLLIGEKFLHERDLPDGWAELFFEESKIAAALLGIPPDDYPTDLTAFRAFFAEKMNEKGSLGSARVSREISEALIFYRKPLARVANLLAIGWLPDWLCERLGLDFSMKKRRQFERLFRFAKWAHGFAPRFLKTNPAWFQAHARIKKGRGERLGFLEMAFVWAGKKWKMPLGIPQK